GGSIARGGRGDAPGCAPPEPRCLAVAAQRVGPQRRLPEGGPRDVADVGEAPADRRRRGDPGDLSAVLHARDVRGAARVRGHTGELRARAPGPAGTRVPRPG